MKISKLIFNFE